MELQVHHGHLSDQLSSLSVKVLLFLLLLHQILPADGPRLLHLFLQGQFPPSDAVNAKHTEHILDPVFLGLGQFLPDLDLAPDVLFLDLPLHLAALLLDQCQPRGPLLP